MSEIAERIKAFLQSRKRAYQATFQGGPDSERVLRDLANFCRADKSTFHPDPRVAANLDGRREVFLRITQHLNLSAEELHRLYGKGEGQ